MPQMYVCPKCKATVEGDAQIGKCTTCNINFVQQMPIKPPEEINSEELIHWDSRFLLNIPGIDEQHEKLCGMINNLYHVIHSNKHEANFIPNMIYALGEYAFQHFRFEELLFTDSDYPDIKNHLHEHQKFENKIKELKKGFSEEYLDLKPILRYLVEWFVKHVQQMDRTYKPYLKE